MRNADWHAEARRCGEGYHEWEGTLTVVGETDLVGWACGSSFELLQPEPGWPEIGLEGVQIDLAFDREDGVITMCEMKRQTAPVGKAVIAEVERKVVALREGNPRRTVQPVLIVNGPVSKEVEASVSFFRVLQAEGLMG